MNTKPCAKCIEYGDDRMVRMTFDGKQHLIRKMTFGDYVTACGLEKGFRVEG